MIEYMLLAFITGFMYELLKTRFATSVVYPNEQCVEERTACGQEDLLPLPTYPEDRPIYVPYNELLQQRYVEVIDVYPPPIKTSPDKSERRATTPPSSKKESRAQCKNKGRNQTKNRNNRIQRRVVPHDPTNFNPFSRRQS